MRPGSPDSEEASQTRKEDSSVRLETEESSRTSGGRLEPGSSSSALTVTAWLMVHRSGDPTVLGSSEAVNAAKR